MTILTTMAFIILFLYIVSNMIGLSLGIYGMTVLKQKDASVDVLTGKKIAINGLFFAGLALVSLLALLVVLP